MTDFGIGEWLAGWTMSANLLNNFLFVLSYFFYFPFSIIINRSSLEVLIMQGKRDRSLNRNHWDSLERLHIWVDCCFR
jgi:cellobiose-specific phosphotransferase system component IIC